MAYADADGGARPLQSTVDKAELHICFPHFSGTELVGVNRWRYQTQCALRRLNLLTPTHRRGPIRKSSLHVYCSAGFARASSLSHRTATWNLSRHRVQLPSLTGDPARCCLGREPRSSPIEPLFGSKETFASLHCGRNRVSSRRYAIMPVFCFDNANAARTQPDVRAW